MKPLQAPRANTEMPAGIDSGNDKLDKIPMPTMAPTAWRQPPNLECGVAPAKAYSTRTWARVREVSAAKGILDHPDKRP